MKEVAQNYSDYLLNAIIVTLYKKYKMDEKANLFNKLCFIATSEKFTHVFFMVFNKFVTGQKNFYLKKMICFHPLLIRCSSTDINITIQFIIYSTTSPIFWEKKNLVNLINSKTFLENKNVNFFHQLVIFRSLNIVELKL